MSDIYDKYLNPEEALFRRKTYQLNRKKSGITIVTYESITGITDTHFFAIPDDHEIANTRTKDQFICGGTTEAEALKNCLEKIQNLSIEDLYEQVDDSLAKG